MPLRLILDVQACQSVQYRDRGCARYVASHADALVRTGRVVRTVLNPDLPPPLDLAEVITTQGGLTWNTASTFRATTDRTQAAYLLMSPFENLERSRIVPAFATGVPLVSTLYDLIPWVMQREYLRDPLIRDAYERRLDVIRRSDLVLAISEHTRADAIEHLGISDHRIAVIGAGADSHFVPSDDPGSSLARARRAVPAIRSEFVLCVTGADDNRKNVRGLLRGWARSMAARRGVQLIVVCALPASVRVAWEAEAASLGLLDDSVVFTGWVPEPALVALYQAARACVAPSLYEGFGLPLIEAGRCGTATVAARRSSFRELIEDDSAMFEPDDPNDIAQVLDRVLNDDQWRAALAKQAGARAEQCRWETVAAQTLLAIDERLRPTRQGPSQPRIAICAPVPPTPSGVADYTERLLPALAARCAAVDVFVEGPGRSLPSDPANLMRLPLSALTTHFAATDYHAVVHVIGGSEFHRRTARLAERVPGFVWLHDVRLCGIYVTEAREQGWGVGRRSERRITDELRAQYGAQVPPEILDNWMSMLLYDRYGIGMTRSLVRSSRGVLVNSHVAAAMVRADQAPDELVPPISVLPFGVPSIPPVAVQREPGLIVVLGQLSPVRMSDFAIRALAQLQHLTPDARMVFVGNAPSDYASELRQLADGVAPGRVQILGAVPGAEYQNWVGRASVALQLRAFSRGESSATVADCLAASTPVVTNVLACRELPHPLIRFVESPTPAGVAATLHEVLTQPLRRDDIALPDFGDVADALLRAVVG